MDKRFINKEFVFPVIIAIIAVSIVSAIFSVFIGNQYFYNNNIEFAKIGAPDARQAEKGTDTDVRELIKPDTAIGSVTVGDTVLELVFSPDYADAKGRFCQLDNGILISDIGNAVIYCNKINGDAVRKLAAGDIVNISTFYGDYQYRVVSSDSFSEEPSEHNFASGIGRCVTLCTAKNSGAGMTSEYIAFNCELVSGTPIEE